MNIQWLPTNVERWCQHTNKFLNSLILSASNDSKQNCCNVHWWAVGGDVTHFDLKNKDCGCLVSMIMRNTFSVLFISLIDFYFSKFLRLLRFSVINVLANLQVFLFIWIFFFQECSVFTKSFLCFWDLRRKVKRVDPAASSFFSLSRTRKQIFEKAISRRALKAKKSADEAPRKAPRLPASTHVSQCISHVSSRHYLFLNLIPSQNVSPPHYLIFSLILSDKKWKRNH